MENTKIQWAHHTFNPWYGCTKVSAGCDHCYAERRMDKRFGRVKWGPGQPRTFNKSQWDEPYKWNRRCRLEGHRERVFTLSLGDWLDPQVESAWLLWLLLMIQTTPNLDWLLLTKRPQLFTERLRMVLRQWLKWGDSTYEWLKDWLDGVPPRNVWLGVSIEDQATANLRIPRLLKTPAALRFVSIEPMLGPIDLSNIRSGRTSWNAIEGQSVSWLREQQNLNVPELDWVIVGGETGPGARPMHPDWPKGLLGQCIHRVPFFFKEWGDWLPEEVDPPLPKKLQRGVNFRDWGNTWSVRKPMREPPRTLGGREWNRVPESMMEVK